jgi:hypothetical protein
MRLWSLHPSYLDRQGLLACWREGLLARKVLLGQTRGYRNHPQLLRFKLQPDALAAVDGYLLEIYAESQRRGYSFDRSKIDTGLVDQKLTVTDGQLNYELEHLKNKLYQRDMDRYERLAALETPLPHLLFEVVPGGVEAWERMPVENHPTGEI